MHSRPPSPASFAIQDRGEGRVVLETRGADPRVVVFSGFDGPPLPSAVTAARLEQAGPGTWRLIAEEGTFEFRARGMESMEPWPQLFDELLSAFALRERDRKRVGVLLRLLRLPGGAWLLRRWHTRRR